MAKLGFKIVSSNGEILQEKKATNELFLIYKNEYTEGDTIQFTTDNINAFYIIQVDDALGEAFTYITKPEVDFLIPFGEKKVAYSPKTFSGKLHSLMARVAYDHEVAAYKNLAKNVMDQHSDTGCYPHASANVETRGESVFAARNAINGGIANDDHGPWPYDSWGINQQDDAEIKIEFGRKVAIDQILIYTRADFPHDNWWTNVTLSFSDGSQMKVDLEKSLAKAHVIPFEKKTVEWVKMSNMIKADDPSPFPALTQLEVYGVEA
ncbi:MAG TPA: carbohydrate-binding protein [Epulopiscium sp.]|nr:carbohydrate-binding protein [Candidatus Epulonipiscium sp.]